MSTCDDATRLVCRAVFEVTGNADLADTLDVLLGRPLRVVLIIVVAVVLYRLASMTISRAMRRYEQEIRERVEQARKLRARMGAAPGASRAETRRLQRLHAIGGALRSGLGIIIGVTALVLSLAQFVNLGPVLAGAGLAGIIIGFGAQKFIGDLLAGFSMLVEDQYGVGDWIDVDGRIGEVEKVGLRATSFRDIDGTVWHIANGEITQVGNLTQRWARATLDVPLPLDVDIRRARQLVLEVATGLATDPQWADDIIGKPEIWGITEWSERGLRLRVVVATRPLVNWSVNRQLRERLKLAFDREGIRMPVPVQEVAGTPRRAPLRVAEAQFEVRTQHYGPDKPSWERVEGEMGRVDLSPDDSGHASD